MKTNEPDMLRTGKAFHKRVQDDWERTAKGGRLANEHTINLSRLSSAAKVGRRGRLDMFVDELGDFVSVVEIKSTDWDKVKRENQRHLIANHRRQVWKYIEEYLDVQTVDVCAGIIYPSAPLTPGLKDMVEGHMNDNGLQVVWYDDD
jgi:hypothetical protein